MKYWLDEIATMRPGVTHRKVIVLDTIKNARRREPKDVSGIKNVDPPFDVREPSDLLCNRIRWLGSLHVKSFISSITATCDPTVTSTSTLRSPLVEVRRS